MEGWKQTVLDGGGRVPGLPHLGEEFIRGDQRQYGQVAIKDLSKEPRTFLRLSRLKLSSPKDKGCWEAGKISEQLLEEQFDPCPLFSTDVCAVISLRHGDPGHSRGVCLRQEKLMKAS